MTELTLRALGCSVVATAAVTLAACGGSETRDHVPGSAGGPKPVRASRAVEPCPVTSPRGKAPASSEGFNYGNRFLSVVLWPRGRLVAGRLPDGSMYAEAKPDGSVEAKLGWWRAVEGRLTVGGERLDASSPPLRAQVPVGYGPTGFQATELTFPTQGCWKVVGTIRRVSLSFVVLVHKR